MKNEKELVQLFQVEELEQRYEMGWIDGGSVSGKYNTATNGYEVSVTVNFEF